MSANKPMRALIDACDDRDPVLAIAQLAALSELV